ncbi:MAG: transglutaminase domain-containing protein [Chloroflexia bacterium]|nr:transglutaminase domain-containing protein [Chloroflexia bacterium]
MEQSGTQLVIKKGIGFRVYEKDLKHACDTFSLEDKMIYTWQEENIPAEKPEDRFMISFDKKTPYLLTSPNEFIMGGLNGNMADWKTFGSFFYNLNSNRDNLSPEFETRIKQLVNNVTDKKEIVKILYNYLQKNTRYVSIQLGIGGYQTLEASFVEKKGYGDCKALSNYMKAMLKSLGIASYQALISSEEDIIAEFPSNQFDHVILCVPLQKDTLWLECTNQTIPFNFWVVQMAINMFCC